MRHVTAILVGLLGLFTAASALPPHPDLLQRIHNGDVPTPVIVDRAAESLDQQAFPQRTSMSELDETLSLLVLLLEFPDSGFVYDAAEYDSTFFIANTGSVTDYFHEISYGAVDFQTLHLPSLIEPLNMPHVKGWYVNGQQGLGSFPQNSQQLALDAITAVDDFVNFAEYDNNGDGLVDNLVLVHAGASAQQTGLFNDFWSLSWTLPIPVETDSVAISNFTLLPEYMVVGDSTLPLTPGPPAFELAQSHFGMVDLTVPDDEHSSLGTWSLMAYGAWNGEETVGESPAHPDPYNRMRAGWLEPHLLQHDSIAAVFPQVETEPGVYQLWTGGVVEDEYYLVENRRQTGFDQYIPASGLLIYHVDESVTTRNTLPWYPGHQNDGHLLVALEQADGTWDLEQGSNRGDGGDPWPGWSDEHSFNSSSTPSTRSYEGLFTDVQVLNISAPDSVMQADLHIGVAPAVEAPYNLTGSVDNQTGVVDLEWEFDVVTEDEELLYDNGEYTGFYYWDGGTMGVRFTPASICRLLALRFYTRNNSTFEARVYDVTAGTPDTAVTYAVEAQSAHYNWVTADVSAGGLYFNTDFVGAFHGLDDIANLGVDANLDHGRSWDFDGEEWSEWPQAYLVRAVVQYLATGQIVALIPSPAQPISGCSQVSSKASSNVPSHDVIPAQAGISSPSSSDKAFFSSIRMNHSPAGVKGSIQTATGQTQAGGELDEFLEFRVYRNENFVGATTELTFSDTLPEPGLYRYFVTALHDNGESAPSGDAWINYEDLDAEEPGENLLPETFAIESVYPNPFNSRTTVTVATPAQGALTLELFNVLGERVSRQQQTLTAAGQYRVTLQGTAALPTGTYLLRASWNGQQWGVQKLVLIK